MARRSWRTPASAGTDDLQPHSDPYFSQRAARRHWNYINGSYAAINEIQTASLRHFGGGNEVQVVTFGSGYAPSYTVRAAPLTINAAPNGASELGNTVTINTTGNAYLVVGETVTVSGVGVAGYNGTFTVTAVGNSYNRNSFQYTNPISGLPTSGGGTVVPPVYGATESGNTVTITLTAPHTITVGTMVTVANVSVSGYNGTYAVTAVPSPYSFQYTDPTSGLANSGTVATVTTGTAASVTYNSPFQVGIGGNDSAVIGGPGLLLNATNIQTAINAIPGFAGTVTVSSAATTGFTVTYGGLSAGLDVPNLTIDNLVCGGCFASVQETNHGGAYDSFKVNWNGTDSGLITNNTNYSAAAISTAFQGVSEVQTVALTNYTVDGNSYTLTYNGNNSIPITRGGNNTTTGIAAAIQGGNEVQTIAFTNFNAANAGNSYQVQIGGNLSTVLGNGGTAISNTNVAAAINAISGFAGTVSVSGASNTAGPVITFAGASANTDIPPVSIVFGACATAGTPCTATNRETAKGTTGIAGWIPGTTVSIGTVTDTGYTVTFNALGDVNSLSVTNGTGTPAVTGIVTETTKGVLGLLPLGGTASVTGFGGSTFTNSGFQVTFGGTMAALKAPYMFSLTNMSAGASGFVGETQQGGPVQNMGSQVVDTGDHAPVVTTAAGYTIPLRTPFALTGSATDSDPGDVITYMWEQNDRGASAGTALVNNVKTNGPLFREFGTALQQPPYDGSLYNSPGENHTTTDPTRVFPDMAQILINNTNAVTGACPAVTTQPIPPAVVELFLRVPAHLRLCRDLPRQQRQPGSPGLPAHRP